MPRAPLHAGSNDGRDTCLKVFVFEARARDAVRRHRELAEVAFDLLPSRAGVSAGDGSPLASGGGVRRGDLHHVAERVEVERLAEF